MLTFLEETLLSVQKEYTDTSNLILILPSKRAGGFLKHYLRKTATTTNFAPRIISIEEFIEELSGLKIVDTTELLFKSYDAYLKTNSIQEKEHFEVYTSWATTLLGDFNEVDRHLIDPAPFFNYLNSVQHINHWYVKNETTPLIENYLSFWSGLHDFYENLKSALLQDKIGYQGMVYRKATESLEQYRDAKSTQQHIFIGFNALNKAEQDIFQGLLDTGNAKVYWDTDSHFYNDNRHSASFFLRKYIQEWDYFQSIPPQIIGSNFQNEKKFQFVEAKKSIAQAKYVGELLSEFSESDIKKTAVILADETLLVPILYSLPKNIDSVNITMGVSIKTFPATQFFKSLLALHLHPRDAYYYKDILTILNHPILPSILPNAQKIIEAIHFKNTSHITLELIYSLSGGSNKDILTELFGDWENSSKTALQRCLKLVEYFREAFLSNPIELTVLHQLNSIFSKINALNDSFLYLKSVKTIYNLFTELITTTTLDFKGDAYNGLQIMGVLESRVLDFENIIMTSVNEGMLPGGKSNASFITNDIKQQFGLPHFTEKDAIYTYHFYHLLHRAKQITLLYNNQSDGLNAGEKSRFLLQLEVEKHANHNIEKIVLAPAVEIAKHDLKTIEKTEGVMQRLMEIAGKGFSPSSLTSYIRNPMDFYFDKVLGIGELDTVEETVAPNTLGTIVHDTLEKFYKPYEGDYLSNEILLKMKDRIHEEVTNQFQASFKAGSFNKGKNLLIFEVAKRYVSNFIDYEIEEVKKGNKIKIIQIETSLEIEIPISELNFPVKIRGKVDRVDQYNGQLRIIDYKTGRVEQASLEIIDWSEITKDYKYSKAMQVLAYALMINKTTSVQNAEAGIISFKNLKSGFLKFATKDKSRAKVKETEITLETLEQYTLELKKLIVEICDKNIPFTEKEIN